MDKNAKCRMTSVGGQALIEGVMMNGPKGSAISVRRTDGEITTELSQLKHIKDRYKILGWPFIRGIVNFIETMIVGYKSLMRSAELSGQLDAEEETADMSKLDKWLNKHLGPKMFAVISAVASVLAVFIAFALFLYLPTLIVDSADKYIFHNSLKNIEPLFEGIIRMAVVIIYMAAVSQMKDIKRVFMYHGAEHKSIFCYEQGLELTVENARSCKRFHPRCGTNFIFVVLLTSIIVSSLIVVLFPALNEDANRMWWVLVKLVGVIPLVTGISYEFIKYAGRHNNLFTKIVSAPGLWMQRITTKEPDSGMLEVALASLKAVITDNPEDDTIK